MDEEHDGHPDEAATQQTDANIHDRFDHLADAFAKTAQPIGCVVADTTQEWSFRSEIESIGPISPVFERGFRELHARERRCAFFATLSRALKLVNKKSEERNVVKSFTAAKPVED